jgi:hypothetical protein
MNRLSRALLASLAVHFILFALMTRHFRPLFAPPAPPVFIEFKSPRPTTPTEQKGRKRSARNAGPGRGKAPSLGEALRTDMAQFARDAVETQNRLGGDNPSDGMQVNLQKTIDEDHFYPRIWRQIRAHLGYRPEHVRERVAGRVVINIRLDRNGKLIRIVEETASGPRNLQGWTILCLIEALKNPFLSEPLPAPLELKLDILFTLQDGDMDSWTHDQNSMHFTLRGSTPMHQAALETIHDVFADEPLKNHAEWNYFTRLNNYLDACENKGSHEACQKVADQYEAIGNTPLAQRYRRRRP